MESKTKGITVLGSTYADRPTGALVYADYIVKSYVDILEEKFIVIVANVIQLIFEILYHKSSLFLSLFLK